MAFFFFFNFIFLVFKKKRTESYANFHFSFVSVQSIGEALKHCTKWIYYGPPTDAQHFLEPDSIKVYLMILSFFCCYCYFLISGWLLLFFAVFDIWKIMPLLD